MKLLSGAIEAGVTDPDQIVRRLSSVGIGDAGWTVQLTGVGAAQVTASIGPTSSGPWTVVADANAANDTQSSEVSSAWYIKIEVVSGTTDASFEAHVR